MGGWPRLAKTLGVPMLLASGSQVADDPHSRIHQGKMYHVSHKLASVADDGTLTFALTTPADDWPHVAPTGAAEGAFDFEIFEGASITGGTSLTAQNHLRGSSNTFGGSIVHTPTVNDAGTRLLFRSSGGSGAFGILSSPGLASFNYEWVLLAETTYLFRITNRSGGAVDMSMAINFYSAPDLN